jgi:2,3,4,5-tetrahydropyridine-2-carboxylate N-succinyltransferase
MSDLAKTIDDAFESANDVSPRPKARCARRSRARSTCSTGRGARRRERANGKWQVNQWLKKAVLLSFRLNDMGPISGAAGGASWWDKVPSKFEGWGENRFRAAAFARAGLVVRRSAYIAPNVVLMPSFVQPRRLCR